MRARFDEYDLRVYEAHSLVESDGLATYYEMRRVHEGPLPVQRLQGMCRRGLLYFNGREYSLPLQGIRLAEEYRDAR